MSNTFDDELDKADEEDAIDPQEQLRLDRERLRLSVQQARKQKARRDTAERTFNQRPAGKAAFHKEGFDPTCVICQLAHTNATREERDRAKDIKFGYVTGLTLVQIKEAFDVPVSEVKRHAKAHNWKYERAKAGDDELALIIRKGAHNILTGEAEVDTSHLLEAIKWVDKREGRIIDKTQNETSVQVVFSQEPLPITPAKNARAAELETTTKPLMLQATSVEVLDAPAESVEVVPSIADDLASKADAQGGSKSTDS